MPRVKRGVTGTAHTVSSLVKLIPSFFSLSVKSAYFESKVNDKVFFNPVESVGVSTNVGAAVTTNVLSAPVGFTSAFYATIEVKDTITSEKNLVDIYVTQDGTNSYFTEYYVDTGDIANFSSNFIGTFISSISSNILSLEFLSKIKIEFLASNFFKILSISFVFFISLEKSSKTITSLSFNFFDKIELMLCLFSFLFNFLVL